MNIDAQIQEILLRSSPANDNNNPNRDGCILKEKQSNSGISVIGNNNVIIGSGVFSVVMLLIITLIVFYLRW